MIRTAVWARGLGFSPLPWGEGGPFPSPTGEGGPIPSPTGEGGPFPSPSGEGEGEGRSILEVLETFRALGMDGSPLTLTLSRGERGLVELVSDVYPSLAISPEISNCSLLDSRRGPLSPLGEGQGEGVPRSTNSETTRSQPTSSSLMVRAQR